MKGQASTFPIIFIAQTESWLVTCHRSVRFRKGWSWTAAARAAAPEGTAGSGGQRL